MGKYFLPAIIFAVCVSGIICFSQGTPGKPMFIPLEKLKPFNMDDFLKPPKMDEKNVTCFFPFIKCLNSQKARKPVCALQRDIGLVTMASECDIHIQNCLAQTDVNAAFGAISDDDIFYFNGQKHNCLYYFKKTKNLAKASILYVQDWVGGETTTGATFETTT